MRATGEWPESPRGFFFLKQKTAYEMIWLLEFRRVLFRSSEPVAAAWPQCKSSSAAFLKKGIGTQQVGTILQRLFPEARVGRADADRTKNKKKWQQTDRKSAV